MADVSEVTSGTHSLTRKLAEYSRRMLVSSAVPQRRVLALTTVALVLAIGVVDFFLGFEISLLVFYCLPVMLAVTALGWRFGAVIAFAAVVTWIGGDIAAGADYRHKMVLWWNAGIALGTYLVIVWLFHIVQTLQREMEARVRERTAALTTQIRERERLEKAVLEISERERRSIGHDLHDGLGQHLTGTAFAGQVLCEKLQARSLPEEEADAWKIVHLVEDGIEKTRRLAKGLLLAEIQRDGLITALEEFAANTTSQFRVACSFRTEGDCDVPEAGVATHLLRIAQEAVRNAIRHGGARQVEIELVGTAEALTLKIRDHGSGIPPPRARGDGLGLRIMAHRAQMIGGEFTIAADTGGGTVVSCRLLRAPSHA
jgi:signal transduction histidine kinase